MDVHPPHERIHTWKDFFIHLATITIGLLIALALEGAVEWLHHRQLVREAIEIIRHELDGNRKLIADNLASVSDDEKRIEADIKILVALRGGIKPEHNTLHYDISWSSFSDSAWRTARDTGAINYMDYAAAQAYADVYVQQEYDNRIGQGIFSDQLHAIAPIFITGEAALMTKDEIQICLQRSADILLSLRGLQQLLQDLDKQLKTESERG